MVLDFNFHFQVLTQEGWIVPTGFSNRFGYYEDKGYFTWFDDKDATIRLFLGEKALFPMHRSFPPNIERTTLFQNAPLSTFGGDQLSVFTTWFYGWLSFEDLILDCWDESYLLVSKRVASSYAPHFQDGQQPFPRERLISAGMDSTEVEDLENTSYYVSDAELVEEPIACGLEPGQRGLDFNSPDNLCEVSWKVSVSSFLGEWRTEEFRKLRQYGTDENLRIICLFS